MISGPAGPARLGPLQLTFRLRRAPDPSRPKKDQARHRTSSSCRRRITPTRAGSYFLKNGFVEREASRKTERYGNIMQVFSTYESRHDAKDEKPFARGINSFQLYSDGTRWWVVTIMWEEETPEIRCRKNFSPVAK